MLYKAKPTDDTPAPLQGQPHPEDTSRAVNAIRELLHSELQTPVDERSAQAAPRETPADPGAAKACAGEPPAGRVRRLRRKTGAAARGSNRRLDRQSTGWQPDWRISAAILVLASLVWNPWFLPLLLLVLIAVSAVIYFSLGPDRVGEGVARWYRRVERRNPDRAEKLRALANRASARLERLSGWLPERWTEGLYFPTFDGQESELDATPHPFDRLLPQERL